MAIAIVVGDTHLPRFGRQLPGPLVDGLRNADLVLHVGDLTEAFVLDLLAVFAPVEAVAGNNDSPELMEKLGQIRTIEFDGFRFGLTHGHLPPGRTTLARAVNAFPGNEKPDAICFGHSHIPVIERVDGTWLLNPGSPTDKRRQPVFGFIRVDTASGQIVPTLQTYAQWRTPARR